MKRISESEKFGLADHGKNYKTNWYRSEITEHHYDDGRPFYLPKLNTTVLLRCVKCSTHHLLDKCDNCDGRAFASGRGAGIYCLTCQEGFTKWTCESCGTRNPTSTTLVLLNKVRKGSALAVVFGIAAFVLSFIIALPFATASHHPVGLIGGGCCFPIVAGILVFIFTPRVLDSIRN